LSKAFSAARLRHSPSFPRLTGVNVETVDPVLTQLTSTWGLAHSQKTKSGRPWKTGGLEDHLLIMLIYDRCYITREFLGVFYNVDKSAICRAIKRIKALAKPLLGVRRKPVLSREEAGS
jgi:hypothetical protein